MSTDSSNSTPKPKIFQALSNPSFQRIWLAAVLWYVSVMMEMAVVAWLVLTLTDSPGQVALVGFFRFLPMFLFGVLGGSIADRLPKKRLLVGVQSVGVFSAGAMTLLLVAGLIQPWHAFVAMFLTGAADVMDFSSRRAIIAEVIEKPLFLNAVSLHTAALTGSGMVGPALGGLFIAVTQLSGAYAAITVLYAVALGIMLSVRYNAAPRAAQAAASLLSQVRGALLAARANRTVWVALLVTIVVNLFGFPFIALVSAVARDGLGVGGFLYGILSSAAGFGALFGSLLIASRGTLRPATLYSLGGLTMLVAVCVFALSPFYPLSFVMLVVAGFGMSGFATMQSAIVLQAVAPEMRGRAMGAIALGIGAGPLGTLVLGSLSERLGAQAGLAILTGTGVAVLGLLIWRYPELRDAPPRAVAAAPSQAG